MLNGVTIQYLVRNLSALNDRQANITNQMSSGVRLTSLATDPAAASRSVALADTLGRNDSFLATAATVTTRMQTADTALAAVVTQLTSAVSTAVGALNSTLTDSQRSVVVQQLKSMRDTIQSLANSSYDGGYLFSGTGNTQPFTQGADGSISYGGTSQGSTLSMPDGTTVQTSLAGSSVFTAGSNSVFAALDAAIAGISNRADGTQGDLVSGLRNALGNVSTQRALLNLSQNRLSAESDYVTAQKSNLKVEQTALLAPDTVQLATELSAVTSQRSALLSTIGIVQKGTLFDYL